MTLHENGNLAHGRREERRKKWSCSVCPSFLRDCGGVERRTPPSTSIKPHFTRTSGPQSSSAKEAIVRGEKRKGGSMGNCRSTARVLPVKTHVPDLEWKIQDFSSLLETGAKSATSGSFHCSGFEWYLHVNPMHEKPGAGTPYVALFLMLSGKKLERGHTVHAMFELSIYNHSKGMYCGCQANYNFDLKNNYSKKECLIPLQELLKSSAFLVDDSCVFGVKILKIDVSSPEKKAVLVEKKATTVQNLFVQKKGFIKGTYTWTMNNFQELDMKHFVRSPKFEVGEHKWYIGMYPRGDKGSTCCLSLYLYLDASKKLPLESKKVATMTLSILDQKTGKYMTRTAGLWVCTGGWGWSNFLGLEKLKDPFGGYLVGSSCVVKADVTILGSSTDG